MHKMAASVRSCVYRVAVILVSYSVVLCDDEFDGLSTLPLEHSFDSGLNPSFSRRGQISIRSLKSGVAHFSSDGALSAEEKASLKNLAQEGGLYRIRVPTKLNAQSDSSISYVSSFVPACALYESKLSDLVTINVDTLGHVIGVTITTHLSYCKGNVQIRESALNNFNTSVDVVQTATGPSPDTQGYIQKMEQEKADKAKGQQSDNRSFIAKYWMYLVPLFIVLMVASNSEQPAQGGGGGR